MDAEPPIDREVAFITLSLLNCCLFKQIFAVQPTPFIDEIFHYRQTEKYCSGIFDEWDPKITTFPGMYVLPTLAQKCFNISCSLYNMRLVSLVFSILNFRVIHSILTVFYTRKGLNVNSLITTWSAANISIFPVMYLFAFFYYTDMLSTFLVLLAYRFHLERAHWNAAVVGLLSVCVRQSNVIWIGFFILDEFLVSMNDYIPTLLQESMNIMWHQGRGLKGAIQHLNEIPLLKTKFLNSCYNCVGYIIICFAFTIFLILNKGLVLGDKAAHQPVLHLCQIFYFSLFCFMFSFPFYLNYIGSFLVNLVKYYKYAICIFIFCGLVVLFNTQVHPYLLADNRHYTFYLWKRVFEQPGLRFYLIPLYLFTLFSIGSSLREFIWLPAYWLCITMLLVPQKLLEFRYFIVPYLFMRIHLDPPHPIKLSLESILFLGINAFVVYIFHTKEFYWRGYPGPQRIIW